MSVTDIVKQSPTTRVGVRIRAKKGNSGFDYQQAANFLHKIMVVRTLTKKTILLPSRQLTKKTVGMRRRKLYKKMLK